MRTNMFRGVLAAAAVIGAGAGPAMAATVTFADNNAVAYTTTSLGTSTAPGVSSVAVSGSNLNFGSGGGSHSWTDAQMGLTLSYAGSASTLISGGPVNSNDVVPTSLSGGFTDASVPFVYAGDYEGTNPLPNTLTMTMDTPQSYWGGVIDASVNATQSVSFYSGSTLLLTLNPNNFGQIVESNQGSPQWEQNTFFLNADFLGGQTFNKIVLSEVATNSVQNSQIQASEMVISAAPVSLSSLAADAPLPSPSPMPALAGTLPGVLAGLLGFVGLRRRRAA